MTDSDRHDATGNVYSIPPEIWCKVFMFGKAMTDDLDDYTNEESARHPKWAFHLIVSHSFSYFRQIALSSPQLWTSIQIDSICSFNWLLMVMERNGSLDLDINIELTTDQHLIDKAELALSMDIVNLQCHRWRSLIFTCDKEYRGGQAIVKRLCDISVPRLQHLSLDVMDIERLNPDAIHRDVRAGQIFQGPTPHLAFVRLRGFALHMFRPQLGFVVTLHLDQTKHLPLPYSTFYQILTCSLCLAHLSIYGDIIDPVSWHVRRDPIPIPNLRSLRIRSSDGDIYSGILMAIDAPFLESLTIKELQEGDLDPLWQSGDYTKFSNVKHLAFIEFEPSTATYRQFFTIFPAVIFFSSWAYCSESILMKILTRGSLTRTIGTNADGYFVPWPQLRELTFPFADEEGDYEDFDKFLESRRQVGFPISKIHLEVAPEDHPIELSQSEESRGILEEAENFCGKAIWPLNRVLVDPHYNLF